MAHIQLEAAPAEVQKCIQDCLDCYDVCIQTEAHCVRQGGKHAEPRHIRLLADCARLCQVAAEMMLRGSEFQSAVCRVCAEVCSRCGKDCERFEGDPQMQKCAEVCLECADSCGKMSR